MNCKHCQQKINRLVDRELPAAETTLVEEHLSSCQDCRRIYNGLAAVKDLVAAAPAYTANQFLWTRIAATLKQEKPIPINVVLASLFKIWVPVACSLILVFSLVLKQILGAEASLGSYLNQETPALQMAISEIPATPENLERIAINTIVYQDQASWRLSLGEANHAGF